MLVFEGGAGGEVTMNAWHVRKVKGSSFTVQAVLFRYLA